MATLSDAAARLGFVLTGEKTLPSGRHQVSFTWHDKVRSSVIGSTGDEVYEQLVIRSSELIAESKGLSRLAGRMIGKAALEQARKE